jgi:hypothetical protein
MDCVFGIKRRLNLTLFHCIEEISFTFKTKQYIYTIIILLCIYQAKGDNIGYILYHRNSYYNLVMYTLLPLV